MPGYAWNEGLAYFGDPIQGIKTIIDADKVEQERLKNVMLEIIKNDPNCKQTIDATPIIEGANSILDAKEVADSFVDNPATESFKKQLKSALSDMGIDVGLAGGESLYYYLLMQYYSNDAFIEIFEQQATEYNDEIMLKAAQEIREKYNHSVIEGIKDVGKDVAEETIQGIVEGGLTKLAPGLMSAFSTVTFTANLATEPLRDYVENSNNLALAYYLKNFAALEYGDLIRKAEKDSYNLTSEEKMQIIEAYDLLRACQITMNTYAAGVNDRDAIVQQLNSEIELLKSLPIEEWRENDFYRDDFYSLPEIDASADNFFGQIIKNDKELGYSNAYLHLTSDEKEIVKAETEKINKVAVQFSQQNSASYWLKTYDSKEGPVLAIVDENGEGLMIGTCTAYYVSVGMQYESLCIVPITGNRVNSLQNGYLFDETIVEITGNVAHMEDYFNCTASWEINNAAVKTIIDTVNSSKVQIQHTEKEVLREKLTTSLLKEVLKYNWWDSYDALKKQVVSEQFVP